MDSSGVKHDYDEKDASDPDNVVEIQDGQFGMLGSSARDGKDMDRMGKRQELRRNFRRFSIFCFTMVLMATWEGKRKAVEQGSSLHLLVV